MSTKYLGSNFDIHGGGLDLRFPHHENELAQSRAAGDQFANIWMHSGLLNVGGDKMSKSLGNSVFASDLFATFSPLAVRYFLTGASYRSILDFSNEAMERSAASLERLKNFLQRARQALGADAPALPDVSDSYASRGVDVPAEFAAALDDDLGVPRALSVVFASVSEGAKLLDSGSDRESLARIVAEVELMLDILGVNPSAAVWAGSAADAKAESALDSSWPPWPSDGPRRRRRRTSPPRMLYGTNWLRPASSSRTRPTDTATTSARAEGDEFRPRARARGPNVFEGIRWLPTRPAVRRRPDQGVGR